MEVVLLLVDYFCITSDPGKKNPILNPVILLYEIKNV
jgi:hypothetical protein